MDHLKIVQLIGNPIQVGVKRSRKSSFEWDTIYKCELLGFEGTEQDWLDNNLAYKYIELERSKRLCFYTSKENEEAVNKNEALYFERLIAKKALQNI